MKIALFGCGKVGFAIAMLGKQLGYDMLLFDINLTSLKRVSEATGFPAFELRLDEFYLKPPSQLLQANVILSALPFFETFKAAQIARKYNLNYVDLTEDIESARKVAEMSQSARNFFMPQTGLAPGLISVYAKKLYREFNSIQSVQLRVGALPLFPNNRLKYNLTWSTEGLINEYIQDCVVIQDGEIKKVPPLEGYETFSIDGVLYEAFNTSGGLGSLAETLLGKALNVNYKSIRYPGHREFIKFLLDDLQFRRNPSQIVQILENSIPSTAQDKCLVFVSVIGEKNGKLEQKTFVSSFYHKKIQEIDFSAIQLVTAAGALACLTQAFRENRSGFVKVENLNEDQILEHEALRLINS
ncbi:MAG: saccharopine dehydrogenase family protein [Deltaproteobacteria bacterium]|nr:saccharopine dehydrogenase family protein [Deltaproteobacteria bacterium]